MRLFIDREEELEYLRSYILKFPLPREELQRSRYVLVLVGPKGIGKSAILRELVERGIEDTVPIYIELRGPYESRADLLIDLVKQLYDSLNRMRPSWVDAIVKVLKAIGVKIVGKDIIEELTAPEAVESLSRSRPTLILKRLEEELCRLSEEENVRLVTIYDEFQNFLKTVVSSEDRYKPLLDTFVLYLSKTQEWGFSRGRGYPIRILAASDYTTYKYLLEHVGIYITIQRIDELDVEATKRLLTALLDRYGISYEEPFIEYPIKLLGGNPSLILRFVDKLRELGEEYLVPEAVDEAINAMLSEERMKIDALDVVSKDIVKALCLSIKRGGTLAIDLKKLWITLKEITISAPEDYQDFVSRIDRLLEENILQILDGNKVAFQNKLIMYAAMKFFKF